MIMETKTRVIINLVIIILLLDRIMGMTPKLIQEDGKTTCSVIIAICQDILSRNVSKWLDILPTILRRRLQLHTQKINKMRRVIDHTLQISMICLWR